MSFTNKSPSETYKDLLYVDNSNSGVDSTKRSIKSGSGASSSLSLNDRGALIKSSTDNTTAFDVQNSGGTSKLLVDTTNNYVKANGVFVNTQYAFFGIGKSDATGFLADTHYPLPFTSTPLGSSATEDDVIFGTGTEPATTFTTGTTNATLSSSLVSKMWYVPDNISIDGVTSLEGADAATGDTTRMHLYSYTFTSGSTSCLASGLLLAHNNDVTNAGSEQAYLSTWTVDSASVASGKVILAFFRQDDANSDYSATVSIKYHLTG